MTCTARTTQCFDAIDILQYIGNHPDAMPSFMVSASTLIVILFCVGCKSSPTSPPPQHPYKVPPGQYLFLEREVDIHGVTVKGEYYGPSIDFPTYSFDSAEGILDGLINFPLTDSLIGIYGDGTWLSGDAGNGAASSVRGIYRIPYQDDPATLTSINADGSISLMYRDTLLVLAKGQEWKTIRSRLDTIETGVALLTTTERIANYGLQMKSKIRRWPD